MIYIILTYIWIGIVISTIAYDAYIEVAPTRFIWWLELGIFMLFILLWPIAICYAFYKQ